MKAAFQTGRRYQIGFATRKSRRLSTHRWHNTTTTTTTKAKNIVNLTHDSANKLQNTTTSSSGGPYISIPTHLLRVIIGVVTVTGCLSSLYIREIRDDELERVPLASQSGAFYVANQQQQREGFGGGDGDAADTTKDGMDSGVGVGVVGGGGEINNTASIPRVSTVGGSKRELRELASLVTRAGLMNTRIPAAQSVKEELEGIRSWHRERGYHGGLVLRELTQPLYNLHQPNNNDNNNNDPNNLEGGDDVNPILSTDQLSQRECYYLYYEIKANGHSVQQIFCRGTTVRADILSCLKFQSVHDEELQCHLHLGFRDHADRLLLDVEPLIRHARGNPRATVELCGHSLGGAVAMIVAMKLKKRGYTVVRVTSIAGAKFCGVGEGRKRVEDCLLPVDALRIEDDLDGVQFLPPWLCSLGDKLWFVTGKDGTKSARYLSRRELAACDDGDGHRSSWQWVDSMLWNCRVPETLYNVTSTHRVPSYVSRIEELVKEMEM